MTAPAVPLAVFCGDEHPITGDLCSRMNCTGLHTSDGGDPWSDPDTDDARRNA